MVLQKIMLTAFSSTLKNFRKNLLSVFICQKFSLPDFAALPLKRRRKKTNQNRFRTESFNQNVGTV